MNLRRPAVALALTGAVVLPVAGQAAPKAENACMVTANAKCPGAKLQGQDLRGVNMNGANLQNANLQNTDLRGARLKKANLKGANLTGARIAGTDLSGARLQKAILVRVKGAPTGGASANALGTVCDATKQNTGPNMSGANLQGANLKSANLIYGNFSKVRAQGANATGATFQCATVTGASFQSLAVYAPTSGTAPQGCVNKGVMTILTNATFKGADMTAAVFAGEGVSPSPSTFTSCAGGTFTASTVKTDLSSTDLSYGVLTNANLTLTVLPSSSRMTGTVWNNTVCPSGAPTVSAPCTN